MKPLVLVMLLVIALGFYTTIEHFADAVTDQRTTTANKMYWCIERRSFMHPPLYHITPDIVQDCAILNGSNIKR